MIFDYDTEFKFRRIVELGLFEPVPDFIVRVGYKVIVERPSTAFRKKSHYQAWKKRNKDNLPDWVARLEDENIFYFKIWELANFTEIFEISQELAGLAKRYDEARINPATLPKLKGPDFVNRKASGAKAVSASFEQARRGGKK